MKWYQCEYIDGTPNNQYISDTMKFKSDDVILNPYISTNNNIYYLFKYDQTKSILLPVEYIYEVFVNRHKIDLSKMHIHKTNDSYYLSNEEIWRPITLNEIVSNKYEVSNFGNIRQISGKKVSVFYGIKDKYYQVTLEIADKKCIKKTLYI